MPTGRQWRQKLSISVCRAARLFTFCCTTRQHGAKPGAREPSEGLRGRRLIFCFNSHKLFFFYKIQNYCIFFFFDIFFPTAILQMLLENEIGVRI